MIKRILVVVDASAASQAALEAALDIARRRSAEVTGIGVIDRPWITAPRQPRSVPASTKCIAIR